jgi:cob(I)alamin adenosyltransferase
MTQRIYTKTGDAGETGLFGGGRVSKADVRVCAYGEVDELNAVIGWTITQVGDTEIAQRLVQIQSDLFALGAHLATLRRGAQTHAHLPPLPSARIAEMEHWIDSAEDELPELKAFILPGGSPGGAALHLARTVCRRAERSIVALATHEDVAEDVVVYVNRLSDFLFDMARLANHRAGSAETEWHPREPA